MGEIVVNPDFSWPKYRPYRRRNLSACIVWALYLNGPIHSNFALEDLREILQKLDTRVPLKELRDVVTQLTRRDKMGKMLVVEKYGTKIRGISLDPGVAELPPCPFDDVDNPLDNVKPPEQAAETAGARVTDDEYQPLATLPGGWQLTEPVSNETEPASNETEPATLADVEPAELVASDELTVPADNGTSPELFTLPPQLRDGTSQIDKLMMAHYLLTEAVAQGPPVPEPVIIEAPAPEPVVDPQVVERLARSLEENSRLRQRLQVAEDLARVHENRAADTSRMMRQLEQNLQSVMNGSPVTTKGFDSLKRFIEEKPHAKR